ncbi:hypothetical protein D1AOALGA4SA_11403 [Olavius algarvensis Delta 1 endosymbiont]|nr:hypothetical protein D1AOALGA4SA_11403 [Olavius algarvensis Delta 1 endosymbiont]
MFDSIYLATNEHELLYMAKARVLAMIKVKIVLICGLF